MIIFEKNIIRCYANGYPNYGISVFLVSGLVCISILSCVIKIDFHKWEKFGG